MGVKTCFAFAIIGLLVVGDVIGVMAMIEKTTYSGKENNKSNLVSTKYATDFCIPASYKDACLKSVKSVANNSTANPTDYMIAIIQATIKEVNKAMNFTKYMSIDNKTDPFHHMVVEDCKEFLEYSLDELQSSLNMVQDSELRTLNEHKDDLLNWLAAVYTYQTSCLDEFKNPDYKSVIENRMVNSMQLTKNAIEIVASTSEVLKAFDINLQQKNKTSTNSIGGRRLLSDYPLI